MRVRSLIAADGARIGAVDLAYRGLDVGERVRPLARALAPSLLADAVAEYFFTGTPQEWWGADDFPNVAPPWQDFWVEWRIPRFSNNEGRLVPMLQATQPIAVHVQATEMGAELAAILPAFAGSPDPAARAVLEKARWGLKLTVFVEVRGVAWLVSEVTNFVGPDGALLSEEGESGPLTVFPSSGKDGREPIYPDPVGGWCSTLGPLYLALSFVHCRNVSVRAQEGERPARRKGPASRRAAPRYSEYVLDIRPMQRVLREEGDSETVGLQKALHICRGHFARYGPGFDAGRLFGRLEGTFWVPQHLRGALSAGAVKKDYRPRPRRKP